MLHEIRSYGKHLLTAWFVLATVSCAGPDNNTNDYGGETARKMVRRAQLENAHCGIMVQDVATGEAVLALNTERLFTPASTMKLMTTYAALLRFGPDYRLETSLWIPDVRPAPGIAQNVVLRGGGDPFLGDREWDEIAPAAFDSLAAALKAHGITKIEGALIVDASLFGDRTIPEDWSWGDLDKYYGAPVSSMNAGHNVIIAEVQAGSGVDRAAQVRILPDLGSHIALKASVVTVAGKRRAVTAKLRRGGDTLDVAGMIGLKRETARLAVAVQDPAEYAGLWFERALSRAGIESPGGVRVTYDPIDFTAYSRAAMYASDPLEDIVKRILDESDNLGAECLARHLTIATAGEPDIEQHDTGETGALKILRERGLPAFPPVSITDGSGLSRTNLLAPAHLTWALIEATKEDDFRFVTIVPHAEKHAKLGTHPMTAKHGTRVAAKTGSFQGTRCLAGYYLDEEGEPVYAFAVMVGGLPSNDDPALELEALVIEEIANMSAHRGD